ncbi:MAG: potassium transporter TrkA [Pseudonocardiales bacterium]|nr:MAG: potassium transporter TrkA [Pseudonocardiales bacterium]
MSAAEIPEQLRAHVIVCGLHGVGLRIIEQLHAAGESVVVVDDDPDPRLLRVIADWSVPHLAASAQRATTLTAAGLDGAAALVCVEPSDLHNLEIALQARRLRPDLRVVVQLRNLAVGRAVARVTGAGSVLDVASLAAPAFVEACLSRRPHALDIAGQEFRVIEESVQTAGTLRELFGDLAPIAVVPADGSQVQICPGRDLPVAAGDRIVVVGTQQDLDRRPHPAPQPRPGALLRRRRNALIVAWRYLASFARETDRGLRVTVAALASLAVVSTLLLSLAYRTPGRSHIGPLDSLYFTTETLTTVGFGDFAFGGTSPWLRVWGIALMILGATLVTITYALLTNLLVSRRIEQSLGRQQITRMHGHVILIGLGSVGLRVLEALVAEGQQVVVLDRDENNRYLANARALDVPVIIADSTTPGALASANLRAARAVAVLTSSDLANIETSLAVDELLGERRDLVPVVMRVFDRQLAQTIEGSFGFRNVRSTSALAAPWFVGAALGLDILSTFYVQSEPLLLGRLTIATAGGLQGRTMLDLSARTRVLAISRAREDGRLEHPPRRDTRFEGGDQAYLIGPYEELLQVLRRDQRA